MSGIKGWFREAGEVIGTLVFALEALPPAGRSLHTRLSAQQPCLGKPTDETRSPINSVA